MQTIQYVLNFCSTFIPLIPLIIGLIYRQRDYPVRKYLLYLVGLSAIIQIASLIQSKFIAENYILFHIYTPLEFIIISQIYKIWLSKFWGKSIFDYLAVLFVAFSIYNSLFLQPVNTFNTYSILTSSTIIILLAISYFYFVLTTVSLGPLHNSPPFWINSSLLLYYSGAFLVLGFGQLIAEQSKEFALLIWNFHSVFNIIHYLLFAVALWVKPQTLAYSNKS